jgi:bifunctional DNA-binding transcriptional regulator/antitoxin component of YhaV-PrlF toxin-antitoxin module
MDATIDKVGRIVVPQALRDALGCHRARRSTSTTYGAGLTLIPRGRTASIAEEVGTLVLDSDGPVSDEDIVDVIDVGPR